MRAVRKPVLVQLKSERRHQDDLQEALRHIKALKEKLAAYVSERQSFKADKDALQARNDELESKNAIIHRNLEQCKAELFRLQPANKATDADIELSFKNLSQNVSEWVASVFIAFDEIDMAHSVEPGSEQSASRPRCVQLYVLDKSLEHSGATEYLLHQMVFIFLCKYVFWIEEPLAGLPHDMCATLQDVKDGMHNLSAQKRSIATPV